MSGSRLGIGGVQAGEEASSSAPSAAMSPSMVPVAAGTARRPDQPVGAEDDVLG